MPMPDDDEDHKQRQNLIVLVVAGLLVAGSVWLMLEFRHYRDLQDCVLAGHRNCMPLDVPDR
jgi:hypothetical protein